MSRINNETSPASAPPDQRSAGLGRRAFLAAGLTAAIAVPLSSPFARESLPDIARSEPIAFPWHYAYAYTL